jgi:hypothetical protein
MAAGKPIDKMDTVPGVRAKDTCRERRNRREPVKLAPRHARRRNSKADSHPGTAKGMLTAKMGQAEHAIPDCR